MDAKELRIGNWCSDCEGCNYQVTALSILNMVNFSNGYNPCSIPLTEEWLLKFGFEKITHDVRSYSYHICDKNERYWFFRISGQFGTITREITCVLSYEIKHVHQLQNLYFALTGEELESTQIEKI